MINFYLPNFYTQNYGIVNLSLISLLRNQPELFYDNINIQAVYGCFPGQKWNGGRGATGDCIFSEIETIINTYAENDIPLRFTYTNSLITEKHLDSIYDNFITKMAENGKNEILVNSSLLESYLRKTYPNYKYLSSTTKCLLNEEDIIKEAENYYLTVLDYRKNLDINFLSNLPNPEKYEILINAYCDPNCQNRSSHYYILSKSQLNNDNIDMPCKLRKNSFYEALDSFSTVLKIEDLYTTYVDMGFQHFKIEGRTNHILDLIESYLYYMVKPEYKDKIRYYLLKTIM